MDNYEMKNTPSNVKTTNMLEDLNEIFNALRTTRDSLVDISISIGCFVELDSPDLDVKNTRDNIRLIRDRVVYVDKMVKELKNFIG